MSGPRTCGCPPRGAHVCGLSANRPCGCGPRGPHKKTCPQFKREAGRCKKCGEQGHDARNCRAPEGTVPPPPRRPGAKQPAPAPFSTPPPPADARRDVLKQRMVPRAQHVEFCKRYREARQPGDDRPLSAVRPLLPPLNQSLHTDSVDRADELLRRLTERGRYTAADERDGTADAAVGDSDADSANEVGTESEEEEEEAEAAREAPPSKRPRGDSDAGVEIPEQHEQAPAAPAGQEEASSAALGRPGHVVDPWQPSPFPD